MVLPPELADRLFPRIRTSLRKLLRYVCLAAALLCKSLAARGSARKNPLMGLVASGSMSCGNLEQKNQIEKVQKVGTVSAMEISNKARFNQLQAAA